MTNMTMAESVASVSTARLDRYYITVELNGDDDAQLTLKVRASTTMDSLLKV